MIELISKAAETTSKLARSIGCLVPGGTVFVLSGELGAGKTAFAQGLACGLGVKEQVVSPTFNIANVYKGARFDFSHLDAYRLQGADIYDLGLEEYFGADQVAAVEWGEILSPILPDTTIFIGFFYAVNPDDENCATWRRIVFHEVPNSLTWLEEAIDCTY